MLPEVRRDIGLRDRILALRSLDTFADLGVESLARMAEFSQFRSFKAGDVLLREGQPPPCIFVVLRGRVRVERAGKLMAIVERSRALGVVSVLARDENGVSAVAELESETLELPSSAFLSTFEEDFAVVRNSLRLMATFLLKSRGDLPVNPKDPPEVIEGEYRIQPKTTVERIIEMRRGALFQRCNIDAVIELARRGREIRVRAGEKIWDLGSTPSYSVAIDYGRVRCENAMGESAIVGSEFVLGVMDAFANQPRKFTAIAETDLILFRMDYEIFMSVLETHFKLAMDLVANLATPFLYGANPEAEPVPPDE